VSRWGVQWLSAAADDPVMCRTVWADDPRKPYVLATGRLFDVVAVPQQLGMETFDQLSRRQMPLGATMVDWRAERMAFFLPPRSQEHFTEALARESAKPPEYRYLAHGSYLVVPAPLALTGDRYEWLRPPMRRLDCGRTRANALAVMLTAAAALLERVDRYGQEQATAKPVPGQSRHGESARAQ
jgi:hypothetical protein